MHSRLVLEYFQLTRIQQNFGIFLFVSTLNSDQATDIFAIKKGY